MLCSKIKATAISEVLEIDLQVVTKAIKKFTKKLKISYDKTWILLGGPGIIVEIDEFKFGKVNTTVNIGWMACGCLVWLK